MYKFLDTAIVLTSVCSLGLTTIALAEDKIYEPNNVILKEIQLQRLNQSLTTKIEQGETSVLSSSKPKSRPISPLALNLIKEFEGFEEQAYIDTDGTPVIGYGLSRVYGNPVQIGDRISQQKANAALESHVQEINQELAKVLQVKLSDGQLSALASISFNVGVAAIQDSTLVRKINAQDYRGAADEFLRWDKANVRGRLVQLPGLTRRRHAERAMFLKQNS